MTDESSDPFDQAMSWLRAHEFPDADRVAPGSSVIDATLLRGRVWATSPQPDDLRDLAGAAPEGSWAVAVLATEPDPSLADGASAVAIVVLDDEHGVRPFNDRGHELLEWISGRQRAKSFAARAMHVLAAEREPEAAEEPAATEDRTSGLPVRGRSPAVVRNAGSAPTTLVNPVPEPEPEIEPEPDPVPAVDQVGGEASMLAAPGGDDPEAALHWERIEKMRKQRELRKTFKKR